MANRSEEAPAGAGFIPLIDVIFLLLIFFLVTMTIIPLLGGREETEAQLSLPVSGPGCAEVDMLIQLHKFSDGPEKVYYYTISKRTDVSRFEQDKGNIPNYSSSFNTKRSLDRIFGFDHVYGNVGSLNLEGEDRVVIIADKWITYENILKVVEKCFEDKVQFFCAMAPIDSLSSHSKVDFTPSERIAEIYPW